MINLVDLYEFENRPREGALQFIYDLMAEQIDDPYLDIVPKTMPTWEQHVNHVVGKPFRAWMLIAASQDDLPHDSGIWVGFVSATRGNELAIVIRKKWRGRGFGMAAVRKFIHTFTPHGVIPGQHGGSWVANINPKNEASVRVFEKLGFTCARATYRLDLSKGLEDKSGGTVKIEHRPVIGEEQA